MTLHGWTLVFHGRISSLVPASHIMVLWVCVQAGAEGLGRAVSLPSDLGSEPDEAADGALPADILDQVGTLWHSAVCCPVQAVTGVMSIIIIIVIIVVLIIIIFIITIIIVIIIT
jgi:hypothetical protein